MDITQTCQLEASSTECSYVGYLSPIIEDSFPLITTSILIFLWIAIVYGTVKIIKAFS